MNDGDVIAGLWIPIELEKGFSQWSESCGHQYWAKQIQAIDTRSDEFGRHSVGHIYNMAWFSQKAYLNL